MYYTIALPSPALVPAHPTGGVAVQRWGRRVGGCLLYAGRRGRGGSTPDRLHQPLHVPSGPMQVLEQLGSNRLHFNSLRVP